MKYLKQFLIIILVSCIGELLNYLIPLPIPASIYGLLIMLVLLITKTIRLEAVKETAEFLIDIMSVMFIPAGVGLITYWAQLRDMLLPTIVIIIISSVLVMVVTGKTTDLLLQRKGVDTDE
ncbi:MAG: CidA/LrgA family protein [Tyzzerella sp.]|nr:CidA/LrgA family protein [Tyzzerella sp.]